MRFSPSEILPNIRFTSIVWYFLTSSLLLSLAKSYHQTLDLGTDAALCRFREVYCRTNIIAVLLYFTAAVTFAAEPSVQMPTLRWSGDGEFMSWHWEKLGEAFEDGAARFEAESRIVSPTWASFAGAKEVYDGADGWEGVALGRGQTDIECCFKLIAKLDQVKRIPSEVTNKGGVEAHLRRREVEVPRDDGLHPVL